MWNFTLVESGWMCIVYNVNPQHNIVDIYESTRLVEPNPIWFGSMDTPQQKKINGSTDVYSLYLFTNYGIRSESGSVELISLALQF